MLLSVLQHSIHNSVSIRNELGFVVMVTILFAYLQPTVIVPEGLEPQEFLYLFKGKFIIQKTKNPQVIHVENCLHFLIIPQ